MPAIFTSDPDKTKMQIPAIQVSTNHLSHIGAPKTISIRVAVIPQPFKLQASNRKEAHGKSACFMAAIPFTSSNGHVVTLQELWCCYVPKMGKLA